MLICFFLLSESSDFVVDSNKKCKELYSRVNNGPNASLQGTESSFALGGCARVAEHLVDIRLATTKAERKLNYY